MCQIEQSNTPENTSRCSEADNSPKDRKQPFLQGISPIYANKQHPITFEKNCGDNIYPDNVSGWSESNG
jgi:hypothetical protein